MRGYQTLGLLASLLLAACGQPPAPRRAAPSYYGTLEPSASEAVYFVITDRFVNGDPDNDQRDQGGAHPTFDIPIECPDGVVANIGYLGGDFRGLLDNADYIRDMGFTAVWITPIVDNPDQAFTGGDEIACGSSLTDRGKTGYHGYWGMNFYRVDEHLESPDLRFADLTRELEARGLKTMLDIVANHSSPAWTMPERQPRFGQVFDADGRLVADHDNLHPGELDPANNLLHRFYNTEPDLAQLGSFDPDNDEVMDYLVGAYLQWIDQGAHALRVDTLRHQPLPFWREFTGRIREHHPGMYFLGEAFDYEAENLGPFTWPEHGAINVLDFPLKAALTEVFENPGSDFGRLAEALHLKDGPYHNPYDLGSFYDNHDMARMDASDEGFIDAHHWLFTARGIPVVYYGSEIGFMRGRAEHAGNRNYFGQARIDAAPAHRIHQALTRVARLRRDSVALQRGLQLNVRLAGDEAVFYRVYQHEGVAQTALVMLNKGDAPATFSVTEYLQAGAWHDGFSGELVEVGERIEAEVPAHGVRVFFLDAPLTRADTLQRLDGLMQRKRRVP
ncbi:MAG TPA: alpha-amylase family glycosyl hydrolase [Xanthomonadaceae bacterium]|nr:alpha-amylase family glycosyl hydrolase [Xanthomonadaceae bacterium]